MFSLYGVPTSRRLQNVLFHGTPEPPDTMSIEATVTKSCLEGYGAETAPAVTVLAAAIAPLRKTTLPSSPIITPNKTGGWGDAQETTNS